MYPKKIKTLHISDGSRLVTYNYLDNPHEIFLESAGVPGRFTVTLKEGQYGHIHDASGLGTFQIQLADGDYIAGVVESSDPIKTPEGVNTPEVLVFTLQIGPDRSAR